uniref:Ribose 5-phosphate isomerase, type A n=1 Tax=Tanacetum cinerariifolium TaxID=118510 RepID=A0A6L2KQS5_TANCI|nr:ribose 5-phosphate isomerase, type A [Tanacetum cinerariifolium]
MGTYCITVSYPGIQNGLSMENILYLYHHLNLLMLMWRKLFFCQDDIRGLVRDAFGINYLPSDNTQLGDTTIEGDTKESTKKGDHSDNGVSYKRLLEECAKELYTGCNMILELLRDAFPHLTALPSSAYEAKKFTKDLGLDPRSVRLGLASDGFNPFGTMSTSHSTWPVLLIPYNLPPWICMKRQSFILSSIIPGDIYDNLIDVNGNILRTQKITAKQVYKLKGGEKVLVHVNKDYQLIKNVSGLCSRFMTLILKQPNLCLPDAKDWKECKKSCAAMLIAELRRLSLCKKKVRNDQVHTHTTGAVSFTRTKDIYKVDNKREPNDFESFHLCYKTKDDTYLQEATKDMMVIANQEISSKVKELVGPEGIAEDAMVAKIAREVINKLLGNEELHCYGAGVTKSQIYKFCCDLKRMRGEGLADENHFLKEKNAQTSSCIPDLDNVASTSAADTCDKKPSSRPSPFMDEDHYSPELDEDKCLKLEDKRPELLDWLKTNV